MPEAAVHLGERQGARALRARRRAPAARRLRPDLDLRRDPADRDPRQGTRPHRPVGVLVRADPRDRPEPPARRSADDGRSLECRRLEMLPVEVVVRGYLSGSGWKDYRETGSVCGHALPAGLVESDRLPEPIVTPATKAVSGHDENIDARRRGGARRRRALGRGRVRRARALRLRLPARGGARDHPRRHEVRARARPGRARSCSATRR